ncbi:MAG: uroporphyrinogen-III synthase [Acidimicrobiia bacterium]
MIVSRVAVTTTPDRASTIGETLVAHQLEPVILPCIEVIAAPESVLDEVRTISADADWIVVTSSRAVQLVWSSGGMLDVPVAAVGASTAAAVEAAGGSVEMAGHSGADALTARLTSMVVGRSVVFPHAVGADLSTIESLEKAGARVMAIPVYETRPIAPGLDLVDVVIFGSPSVITGWCRSRELDDLVLAVIGETTERALAENGYQAHVIPDRPDYEALVTALDGYLRERSLA